MPSKINRILIPLIIFICIVFISQSISVGQSPLAHTYMPMITHNQSDWIGPFGGTIVDMAIDPTNPQIVYAGSYGSGIFKSLDGGVSWQETNAGLTNLLVYSLAIDPKNPSVLYAGTYKSQIPNQIFKSVDGGGSWVSSGVGIQDNAVVYCIAIDPYETSILYAATRGDSTNGGAPWNGVVYKSTDSGQSWTAVKNDIGGVNLKDWAYSIMVNPNAHYQVVMATHQSGAYRSNDYGDSWDSIDNGIQPGDYEGRSLVISPLDKLTMFYGVWHVHSVYKSTNGGDTWLLSNSNLPDLHVYSIALDPQNIKKIYLATFSSGIIKSNNGGNTWSSGVLTQDYVFHVEINPVMTNHLLAGTSGDGVFQSMDEGASWSHSSSGIQNADITSVVISPTSSHTLYSSQFGAGVYLSNDRGKSWTELNTGLSDLQVHQLVADPGHQGVLYALTDIGGLFRNDLNSSNDWISVSGSLPLTSYDQPAYPPDHPFATLQMEEAYADGPQLIQNILANHDSLMKMVFAPSNSDLAYIGTGHSGVYRTTDDGQNWQNVGQTVNSVNDIAVDFTHPNQLYAIFSDPNAATYSGVLKKSQDSGDNWDFPDSSMNFYSVAASPTEAGVIYAGTNQGIFRYQSGTYSLLGLSDQTITAITLDPTQPGLIYAGTTQGAFYSVDDGQSWRVVNVNLQGQTIQSISIDPTSHNYVYFGTKDRGIFLMSFQF